MGTSFSGPSTFNRKKRSMNHIEQTYEALKNPPLVFLQISYINDLFKSY